MPNSADQADEQQSSSHDDGARSLPSGEDYPDPSVLERRGLTWPFSRRERGQ